MARGVNKVVDLYVGGLSIPQVASETGMARSTVRHHLKAAGVLRSRAEGIRHASDQGRLGSGHRGKSRTFTQQHKEAISRSKSEWGSLHAKGFRITTSGYVELTRGDHKGRLEHVVKMEARLGRRLKDDECVHHIDGDRQNNADNNLALVTRSGHSRLHRREDALQGINRERKQNGTWS